MSADKGVNRDQVQTYYNEIADAFDASYDWDGPLYPSNRIRMDLCLDQLSKYGAYRVLDAGCGTGIILRELLNRGYDAYGFDFSEAAVAKAQERCGKDRAWVSDLERHQLGPYDAAIVMGALTHPLDHNRALHALHVSLRPGGLLLVELRNDLFNLYTMNEYTEDFLERILPESSLKSLGTPMPYRRSPISPDSEAQRAHEEFFTVPTVWKNPLTVDAEYRSAGFEPLDKLWFHFHAVRPSLEGKDPQAFRDASLTMERNPHDWRGFFMASAFILVARAV